MAESSSRATPQSTMVGRGGGSSSHATAGKGGSSSLRSSSTTATASSSSSAATTPLPPLSEIYPVNTLVELKLSPFGNTIRGLVYCTDEFSNSVVLKKALPHTTVSSEVTIVNAASVLTRKTIEYENGAGGGGGGEGGTTVKLTEDEARKIAGVDDLEDLKLPLSNVSRKVLDERERRAIRLAEESFSHINQRASPEGQKIFDKLLKACNEVVWKGESILVLKEIRVDPPYAPENCSLINNGGGALDMHSLERVKKIVSAAKL